MPQNDASERANKGREDLNRVMKQLDDLQKEKAGGALLCTEAMDDADPPPEVVNLPLIFSRQTWRSSWRPKNGFRVMCKI